MPFLKNSKRYEAEIWRICSKCMISNKCAKFEVVGYMALANLHGMTLHIIFFFFLNAEIYPHSLFFPTPLFLTPIFSIFYTWFLIPPIISSYSTFIPFIHSLIFIPHPDLYPPPQSLFVFPHHPSAISSKTQGTLKGTYPLCCGK